MPDTVNGVAFFALAGAAILGAVMMLATRNVMHAAFWVLEVLVAVAGLFLLLSAEYLALVQLMVYAGAVSVLMVFTVMLTLRRREDAVRPRDLSVMGLALALAFCGAVLVGLTRTDVPAIEPGVASQGIAELGTHLFTEWILPFEVASLVLLVALVGAVWLSGGGDR